MRAYNSTIKLKKKPCRLCGEMVYIFSKGRCADCARIEDNKETTYIEDLSGLIQDADALFSRYIRLKYADENGNCKCYTCNAIHRYQDMDCGHYISRKHYYLRWDERNARPQDIYCNRIKRGNLVEFGKRLEMESPGITEILLTESRIVYKPNREELRTIISDLTGKVNALKLLT